MTSEWCTCDIAASSTASSGLLVRNYPLPGRLGSGAAHLFHLAGLARRTSGALPGFRDREGGRGQANRARFNGNPGIAPEKERSRPRHEGGDRDVHGAVAKVGGDPQRPPVHEEPACVLIELD